MGYSIVVGEKSKNNCLDDMINDAKEDSYEIYIDSIEYVAKPESLDTAPAFGEPTDNMNQRWPSYISWYAFIYSAGLNEIFFDDNDNLIGRHPGYIEITTEIYEDIKSKYIRFKMQNKGAIASFEDEDFEKYDKISYIKNYKIPINNTLARFEWLMFWLDYSMEKYESTIISNT